MAGAGAARIYGQDAILSALKARRGMERVRGAGGIARISLRCGRCLTAVVSLRAGHEL